MAAELTIALYTYWQPLPLFKARSWCYPQQASYRIAQPRPPTNWDWDFTEAAQHPASRAGSQHPAGMDPSEAVANFMAITGADEATALGTLDATSYNLEAAVNLHFASGKLSRQ